MWTLKDKPRTQKVTKALAKEFAEMDPAPHDRPLSERRLLIYQRLLAQGAFRPVTWAVAHCAETGGTYRVNGKHTSVMLSGLDVMPEFFVTVEEYDCETLEDVAKLYATFDSTTQSRSARDIYLSFAATVPELRDLAARNIGLAVNGISYWKWGQGGNVDHQAAERAELLLDHPEFVLWLDDLFSEGRENKTISRDARHLHRQEVCAAMFGTWSKAQKAASEFWRAIRDETGASPTTPDRKLARFLLTHGVTSGRGANRAKSTDAREMMVKCLHAWNAWRKGEASNLNYYPDKEVPSVR